MLENNYIKKVYIFDFFCPKINKYVQLFVEHKMGGEKLDHILYQKVLSCNIKNNKLKCINESCPAVSKANIKRLCLEQI